MNVVHNFSFFAAPSTASPLQASMNKLRVASLNINGGRDPQKRALVADMVAQKKLDILLLQETHSDGDNEVDWGLWWRGLSRLSHGTNLSAGVATLFSPRLDVRVITSTTEIAAGRALAVRAEVQGFVFCLINIYAPSQGSDRLDLFQKVSSFVERAAVLSRLGAELGMVDVWRVKHPTSRQYTWVKVVDGVISAARLDRFYLSQGFSNSSYWHFNVKLLQDTEFSRRFEAFWGTWRGRKGDFECLGQWWEVGKAHIRAFCQQYSSHTTTRVKHTIEHLEREIRDLEGSFSTHTSTEGHTLRQKRQELSSFLQERVKGALVRSRFTSIKEMDAPTSFFFNLERSVSRAKQMLCLRLPDGTMTADQGEMRRHAVDFYGTLYRAEDCSREDELLQGLPRLSQRDRSTLDADITLDELTAAVGQMASGRAPGLDGLPADFYKRFWRCLGADLWEVLQECTHTGRLPTSCQTAVLSLIPKKGDLALLKNWRPVALLCTDYKLLSKVLANRLKNHLDLLVHRDQSYCVPDRDQGDVDNLIDSLDLYQEASSAKVNWEKSEALQVGPWAETFEKKNWEGAVEQVCTRLSKLTVLPSPAGLIERVQKLIVDFFWSGQHWLRSAVLYLPVQEGGQGLVDIASRVTAFRLQAAQRLLYSLGVPWTDMACLLLRKAGRLGYDKHLFLLQPQSMDLTGLTPFYQSVLKAWQVLSFKHKAVTIPGMWIFEEPLFGNSIITSRVLSSASLRSRLRDAGVVKLGHLLKTSVPDLSDRLNMRSSRLLLQLVREVCASLPEALRVFVLDPSVSELWDDECEYVFPSLAVCPAVGQWQPEEDDLLSLKSSLSVDFEGVGRKDLYILAVKVRNLRSLEGLKASGWTSFFGAGSSPGGCWRSLYKPPVDKRTGDLQWRIVHGAVATNRYLVHLDPSTGDGCPFCSQSETIYHLFVQCPRLEGLFGQLQRRKAVHQLVNVLSGTAKLAIWKTRKNRVRGQGSEDVVAMMTGLLAARLRVEFNFYKLTGQIGTFGDIWGSRFAGGMASSGTPSLSIRHGIRVQPDPSVPVEEVLLAVGDQVSPLAAPSTRVTVSGVPPFITNEALEQELQRFGKFASGLRTVGLGCRSDKLKHVLSLRRQCFMFLTCPSQTLDVSFRVRHGEGHYMVYASSGSMRCFECGDVGHKRVACPHRPANEGARTGAMSSRVAPPSGGGDEVAADAGGSPSGQVEEQGGGECEAAVRAGSEGAAEEVQMAGKAQAGATEEVEMEQQRRWRWSKEEGEDGSKCTDRSS
ncbi:Transposon TX1 uncharacterized 149 kDa protein ORF 2 [Takifugu flavidus]|uniref:Transposon TX1 uncharacterized 149 kDa protein ORF 2 n=1 Tax=Takifugu flavidus TaxID=433684 RepID=A0A5C6PDX8_9TELE|nr:Transposon TX1 uncharacterized 149 kDa protein ORF 2 [Takifugu flavidus]